MSNYKHTILFISSTFKGLDMLREAHGQNCYVLLLTEEKWHHEPWPYDAIDEIFFTPNLAKYQDVINTVAYLNRGRHIDYIVPLDEFEVELVSILREHLRLPGMGYTASRRFRDKYTMREVTNNAGIRVPNFVLIKNYDDIRHFMSHVPHPWILKPRAEASAMGIRKIHEPEQVWRALDELGDRQSYYLLEHFIPGDVYHADSVIYRGEVQFVSVQKYGKPPIDVYQGGGVFTSRTIPYDSDEAQHIREINARVVRALGMVDGVTHTEFIRAYETGDIYFLESAARVGGANVADMIAYATNINLWREWARMIISDLRGQPYQIPDMRHDHAGILMTLARQQHPDMSAYTDSEIVWRAQKEYHAGLIVVSQAYDRVTDLLNQYMQRFAHDFMASAPPMGPQRT